jgi:hypothetical protein
MLRVSIYIKDMIYVSIHGHATSHPEHDTVPNDILKAYLNVVNVHQDMVKVSVNTANVSLNTEHVS